MQEFNRVSGYWFLSLHRSLKLFLKILKLPPCLSKLLVRVPMNRLDLEKLLELLVTLSKAIYQKPIYLRCGEVALR
jgi:hypothetical protein